MTKPQFDAAVDALLVNFHGSLTSGRRTDAHSIAVGGFAGDPHTWGLGVDAIWDQRSDRDGLAGAAKALGLRAIDEHTHTHFQPLDFPAGPVTSYGGVTRPLLKESTIVQKNVSG